MIETINLLPKQESTWSVETSADVDALLVRAGAPVHDIDIERIIGIKDWPVQCSDLELLGEGNQGKVYGLGDFAVKFLSSRERYGTGRLGNYNRQEPLNQTRIAEGLHAGLQRIRKPKIKAPRHHVYAEWASTSWTRSSLMVMDRVDVDYDSPEIAAKEVTKLAKNECTRALKKAGIKSDTIYWADLEINILMSGGLPVVIDLLPVDRFLSKHPLLSIISSQQRSMSEILNR